MVKNKQKKQLNERLTSNTFVVIPSPLSKPNWLLRNFATHFNHHPEAMRVISAALETLIPLCSPAAWLSLFTSFCESCLFVLIFCTDCRADWTHCNIPNIGHLLSNRLLTWSKMEKSTLELLNHPFCYVSPQFSLACFIFQEKKTYFVLKLLQVE